jgi:uncharacterized protein involved in exopolysaccharide biosynthesis
MTAEVSGHQGGEEEFSFLDILIVLAKHKKLVAGLPVVAAVLALGYSLLLPNIYTGTTTILPPQQNQSAAAAMLAQLGALGAVAGAKNPNDLYVGMLKSRTIADNLSQRFELQRVYKTRMAQDTRNELAGRTNISSNIKDGIITIQVDDTDPKRAAAIANAYVEELHRLTQTLAVTEASQRRLFFEKQLKLAKDGLGDAEVALKQTQETTGLIKLDDQAKVIIEAVARLRAEIAAREVQLFAMRSFVTPRNPNYVQLSEELVGLRAQLVKLEKVTPGVREGISISSGKMPESGLEYIRKLRDVKYYETIFDLLAKQYEIARIDEARDQALIQVLDRAVEPERKSKPKRSVIIVLTTLAAGFAAMLLAVVREALDRARQDPERSRGLKLFRRHLIGK